MTRLPVFEFDKTPFYLGQQDAFDETVKRIQHGGESHTAIVLPTRYGKSDFIRMTGLHLMHHGAVSGVMVMSPNQVLRNQMVDEPKLKESFRRYSVRVQRLVRRTGEQREGISPYNMSKSPDFNSMVDSELIATTIQMANENLSTINHWIDHLKYIYGSYPVVFVDEAHMTSDISVWGKAVEFLSEAHAFIVLCTATPYRSDGRAIPGFKIDTIREEDLSGSQRLGAHVYRRQGRRVVFQLVAHHVTSFQQAWQESVLCQLSREPFDVDLREHGLDGYEDHMLSRLGEDEARRALHHAVRSDLVIREGVHRLLRNLRHRRREDAPETAGIVFVGSDDRSDDGSGLDDDTPAGSNQYARKVQQIIQEESRNEFNCVIATTKVDSDPASIIEAFSKGPAGGDILVVKMMASAGLDIARLKVALDLSTVRQPASFVQRVMRICTRWNRDKGEPILRAVYITPDDLRGRNLYKDLIEDLGGAVSTVRWDEDTGEFVESTPGTAPEPPPLTTWEAISTEEGEYLEDSDGTRAPGEIRPFVDDLLEEEGNGALTRVVGKAKLGQTLLRIAKQYAAGHLGAPQVEEEASNGLDYTDADSANGSIDTSGFIDNVEGRKKTLRANIEAAVKRLAHKVVAEKWGRDFPKAYLGEEIQSTWVWLYRKAGIQANARGKGSKSVLETLNEDQLRRLLDILKEEQNGDTQ